MILASARVAELRLSADEIAAASRGLGSIELTRDPIRDRRRLLALLARERRRNAILLAELLR